MKIFLYDKYLSTAGGGEKHAGGIAEVLSARHDVTILYSGIVDVSLLSTRLNLNLARVEFISFGEKVEIDSEVTDYTHKHQPDIFINATYLSTLVIKGPKNVSLIFFPKCNVIRKPSLYDKLKHKAGNLLFNNYTQTVNFYEGFGHEELINYNVGKWSKENATLLITKPFKKVAIYYENLGKQIIRDAIKSISIHGHKLNFNIINDKITFTNFHKHSCGIHLKFNTHKPLESNSYNTDTRDLGMFLTHVDTDALNILSRVLIKLWRSKFFKKAIAKLYVKWTVLNAYNKYEYFLSQNINLSNSNYTRQWIRKIYGSAINIEMLYPPVDVDSFIATKKKENIIINVGRFFIGGHNKKQVEIIKAFKKMYDEYPEVLTYSLHICGGTHPEKHHQEYLKMCRLSAQGYPIFIHEDIQFQELVALYAKAKIFWHAAGMHESEELHPDKFEHFGITTVEAMASGCVPVVIGVAGQKEIVEHMQNGMLWQSEKELIDHTLTIIQNEKTGKELASNARLSARKFSREKFDERVRTIFEKIIEN
jgi:glycosyltransferase involved in cell wall biosynthesis